MVYRFIDEGKAKAKAQANSGGGGGGKNFAPKKPSIITFRDPNKIEVDNTEVRKSFEKNGYHILPYSLTGRPAIFEELAEGDDTAREFVWYGEIYNVEL